MKVTLSPLADAEVDETIAHIAKDDPAAAPQLPEHLLERVASLARFPYSGQVLPEVQRDDIREIIGGAYRVMYRRREDSVEIAAIRHHARDCEEGMA